MNRILLSAAIFYASVITLQTIAYIIVLSH